MRYQSLFCCGLVVTLLLCGCSSTKNNKDSSIEESSVITESDNSVISETEESSEQEKSSRGLKTSSEIQRENKWKNRAEEDTFTLEDVKQVVVQSETEAKKQDINRGEYIHNWFISHSSYKYNPFAVDYNPVLQKIGNASCYDWYSLNNNDSDTYEFVCYQSFMNRCSVIYHLVCDKSRNVLSQDIVFTPEEPNSDGLTIEEAKEMIKNIAANPPSDVRSVEYYILSEFSKKTAPTFVVEGQNKRTFFEINCGTDKKGTIECIGWTFGWDYYNKVPQETPITYQITNASTHEIIEEGTLYDPKAQ